jgi:methyl-accepting chemotaxis protein
VVPLIFSFYIKFVLGGNILMKFTIKSKLIAAFGIIILLSSFLEIYSISSMKTLKDKSNEITRVWLNGNDLAHQLNETMSEYRLREYRHVLADDTSLMDETEKELQDLKNQFETELKDYQGTIELQEDKDLLEDIKAVYPKYFETSNRTLELSRQLKTKEAFNLMSGESKQDFDNVNNAIQRLVKYNQQQSNLANVQNDKTYNQSRLLLIIIGVTIIILSIGVAIYIIIGITKPMKIIKDNLDRTANFDLVYDEKIATDLKHYKDEFGIMSISLINMRKALRELIDNIKQNSVNVSLNSDNLSNIIGETTETIEGVATAIDDMAQGSTDLAKNVEDGAEKLSELADEINDVVKGADLMKNYINEASQANSEGMDYIKRLKEAVEANNEVVEKVDAQVDLLDNKSQSIVKISDTIKAIASQVNLLSLNAAIEAAKAGEQGKGFAVVADEIRKLAAETANSIKEIDIIVGDVKKEIGTTKSEIIKAGTVINQTTEVSSGTEKAFKSIDDSVSNIIKQIHSLINSIKIIDHNKNEVVGNITDMSAISEESASTTEEVSASIQQQSASMEQISQSSKDLKQISIELQDLIAKFRT